MPIYGYRARPYGIQYIHSPNERKPKHIPTYYLGMEIELEEAYGVAEDSMFESVFEPNVWPTTDASLDSNGVEFITQPGTIEAWNDGLVIDWLDWESCVHDIVPDQSCYSTNGIHVHVSRSAFNKYNPRKLTFEANRAHLYRFIRFIEEHYPELTLVAGRDSSEYAKWDPYEVCRRAAKAGACDSVPSFERYRPINVNNTKTIELRFFDGRSDPTFIKRSVQLIHAIVEFTRNLGIKDKRDWDAFTAFVKRHTRKYRELRSFLIREDNLRGFEYARRSSGAREYRNTMDKIKKEGLNLRPYASSEEVYVHNDLMYYLSLLHNEVGDYYRDDYQVRVDMAKNRYFDVRAKAKRYSPAVPYTRTRTYDYPDSAESVYEDNPYEEEEDLCDCPDCVAWREDYVL